jgi:hypothetical protein
MKLLVVCIVAFAAVDARSFPKKFDESYKGEEFTFGSNDVDTFAKPSDYYKYALPSSGDEASFFKAIKDKAQYEASKFDTLYDPKEKYDLDTFVKYFSTNPVLGQLSKYFPLPKDTTYNYFYYPVPKEVVELTKTSKDLKDTIYTLVKYYYNLPEDVKATVAFKYDFDNVVKFLFQVYYDIPSVANGLTTYYDIPSAVVAELRTQYDLRKVIYNIFSKYYEFSQFERDYFTKRYFDVSTVLRTLVKVYYGVPQYDNADVEKYYDDAYFKKFVSEVFSTKYYSYVSVVDEVLKRRAYLTETEKEFYDRFFNIDDYLKVVVKAYYYLYTEGKKTPFETTGYETIKKGFFELLNTILRYKSYSGNYFYTEEIYPLEYYYKVIFGDYKADFPSTAVAPKGYYPFNKDFYPFNKEYYPFSKEWYPFNKEYYPFSKEYYPFSKEYYPFSKEYYPFSKEYYPFSKEYSQYKGYYPFSKEYSQYKGYYPFSKEYYPFSKEYSQYNKEYYPFSKEYSQYKEYYPFNKDFFYGKYDKTPKSFYDYFYSSYPSSYKTPYNKNFYDFVKSYYPEEFKAISEDYKPYEKTYGGDYFQGKEQSYKYYDLLKKYFEYSKAGKYETPYSYDVPQKYFDYPFYGKYDSFENAEAYKKFFYDNYKKGDYKYFGEEGYPKAGYSFDKFFGKDTEKYTPFTGTYDYKEVTPFFKYPTAGKYFFEKYFNNKDF